ncbi:MAG: ABC transporter permease [Candidatus Eisenbacteria bacterium]
MNDRAVQSLRWKVFALSALQSIGPVALAIGLGLGIAGALVALLGASPAEFFEKLFQGTLGSNYGLSQVLFKATPLIFCGLAVALAFQARLFNIGAEGQMVMGGIAMAWAGASVTSLPFPLGVVAALAAGALAGAVWGAIPGLLKARTGAHEVIVTIMLNFIAFALANFLLARYLALPETVRTAEVASGAVLPRFSDWSEALRGSPLNFAFVLAVVAALALELWSARTPIGFSLRVLGEGPKQARYAGLPLARLTVFAMTVSGALAALASSNFILGYKHYYEEGFSAGAGFQGIAVALLARNRPLWIVPSAIFFGLLSYGGLVVNSIVPRELIDLVEAVILLLFIVFDRAMRSLPDRLLVMKARPTAEGA